MEALRNPVILPVFKTGGRPYGQRCVRLTRASANLRLAFDRLARFLKPLFFTVGP
jgi:hypothetical protein